MVKKSNPNVIFFKTSHLQTSYSSITLKRIKQNPLSSVVDILNKNPPKTSCEKYSELLSLCEGPTPIVRGEYANFFKSLPH